MKSKSFLLFVGVFLFMGAFYMTPYFVNNVPFVLMGDLYRQYYPFYQEFRALTVDFLKNAHLPFYSYTTFLGSNFYASKSYYMMGDLFNYVFLFLKNHFFTMFAFQTLTKWFVASLGFSFLLKEYGIRPRIRYTLGLMYGFSSWSMQFAGQMTFLSVYSLFPWYLVSVEHSLKRKKYSFLIIMTALLIVTNYYLAFTIALFSPLYFIYRYSTLNQSFNHFKSHFMTWVGMSFIAVLLSSVLLVPSVLYIVNNSRVGKFEWVWAFKDLKTYFYLIQSLVIPTHLVAYSDHIPNPFILDSSQDNLREMMFWVGSIPILTFVESLFVKNPSFRKSQRSVLIGFCFLFLFPFLSAMIHGFSEISYRWSFMWISWILISSAYVLEHQLQSLNYSVVTFWIGLAFINIPALWMWVSMPHANYNAYYLLILAVDGLWLISYAALKTQSLTIILSFMVLESLFINGYFLDVDRLSSSYTLPSWTFVEGATHVLQTQPEELNSYLSSLDEQNSYQFYRVYIPYDSLYWSFSYNMNLIYNVHGLSSYDSTYSSSLDDFLSWFPDSSVPYVDWTFDIKNPLLMDFLNVKYAIVTNESEVPFNHSTLVEDNFLGGLNVYENQNYRPIGYTPTQIITEENYATDPDDRILDTVIVSQNDYDSIKPFIQNSSMTYIQSFENNGNYVFTTLETTEKSFLVLTLPYDQGWSAKVNGSNVAVYKVNGGFMGVKIPAGVSNLELSFIPYGFKWGLALSGLGIFLLLGVIFQEQSTWKRSKNFIHTISNTLFHRI